MSSPESRLKPDHEIRLSDAANAAQPAGSESKQGPNTTTPIAGGISISCGETNAGDDGQWCQVAARLMGMTRHAGYEISQRKRKRVEEIFGWMKTIGLLKKLRHRGEARVEWMFTLPVSRF